jgi:hypothetical protein
MIKKWVMTNAPLWVQGQKHPSTPAVVFKNVYECDKLRRILKSRCNICEYVVSRDPEAVKELLYVCENKRCCVSTLGPSLHQVCDLCYWMWRALYLNLGSPFNPGLKDTRYFVKIDEQKGDSKGGYLK